MANKQNKHTEDAVRIHALEEKVAEQNAEIARLQQKLERMNELLLNAQRAQFGQSSEKRKFVLPDAEQLRIFNEAEQVQDVKAEEPTEKTFTVNAHQRKAKRTVDELTENLPVKEVVYDIPENDRVCSKCGASLKQIGKKFVRRELEIIPKQVNVIEYYTVTYACEECEKETGYAGIYSVEPPVPLIKHSLASPSTIANVMTMKYVDGIPLYRQEQIWKRDGVELHRATLANWMIQTAQTWLKPLYRRLKAHLLEQSVIHADETVVQVLKEEGKSAASESRMWVYASGDYAVEQVRYFEYQPDRSGKHPAALLKNYDGCLVTDGYAGYDKVEKAMRCGCWAHMRRKWREAMPKGATTATSKAAIGYEYCNKLFALERKFEGYTAVQRKAARRAYAEPVLDAYWGWVEKQNPTPGSKLEDAVKYAKNQKQYLNEYMSHGEVDISNNIAENAIRPFVIGRKNWLFCDTVRGAEASAIIYSLVETAKENELDPYFYLLTLLDEIRFVGNSPDNATLDLFLPWSRNMQNAATKWKIHDK